jgi:hypothetical protein
MLDHPWLSFVVALRQQKDPFPFPRVHVDLSAVALAKADPGVPGVSSARSHFQ